MAISVDKVYKTVLSILNKESRGFLTPDEFERIGNQVQLDILEKNFHDYNRAVIKHYRGAGVNDYGNIPEKIEQKINFKGNVIIKQNERFLKGNSAVIDFKRGLSSISSNEQNSVTGVFY